MLAILKFIPSSMLIALSLAISADALAEEEATEEKNNAIYIPLDPPFVTNFGRETSARFLQITVELVTRDPKAIDLIKNNRPAIRNNLVFLFSDQDPTTLKTRDGKTQLREHALTEVQRVLKEEGGIDGVEKIYFTSFVMQ